MENKYTPEQQKDIDTRINSFREQYADLIKKFEVDLVAFPQYYAVGPKDGMQMFTTMASITIVDKKYSPVPSPLSKESVIKKQ